MSICVIVGASHAAAQLAPSLRQEGWEGEIIIIGNEGYPPYHRPPLSKTFLSGEKTSQQILIRPEAAYGKIDAKLKLGVQVESIDRNAKTLQLSNGETQPYDKLALCTGARPRQAPIPGAELEGVHYLRSIADIESIQASLQRKTKPKAVILGGGYIGLETAAALNKLGHQVTVLEMMDRVLQRVTATEISEFYTRVHTEEGVKILTNTGVSQISGEGRVEKIICQDGQEIEADLVIIGIGVVPNIELAEAAGLEINNGIAVDQYACTKDPDIVAAGDCSFYYNTALDRQLRLESVPNATEQAKTAAASICGKQLSNHNHPWFWSDQFDIKLQIAGFNAGFDQTVVRGDNHQGRQFCVFYLNQGKLLAADCVNSPKEFMVTKQLLAKALAVDTDQLADPEFDLKTLL